MKEEIKSILLSIKPIFVEMIFNGDKTVELRKILPKNISKKAEIIIYASSPTKCIVGKATVKRVEKCSPSQMWEKLGSKTGISYEYFNTYFEGKELSYGIVLEKIEKLPVPLPLKELRDEINFTPPQSFMYASKALLKVIA